MNKPSRPTYTAELKLEAAQLFVGQNYSTIEAAKSMGVSKSAMDNISQAAIEQHKAKRETGRFIQPSRLNNYLKRLWVT